MYIPYIHFLHRIYNINFNHKILKHIHIFMHRVKSRKLYFFSCWSIVYTFLFYVGCIQFFHYDASVYVNIFRGNFINIFWIVFGILIGCKVQQYFFNQLENCILFFLIRNILFCFWTKHAVCVATNTFFSYIYFWFFFSYI